MAAKPRRRRAGIKPRKPARLAASREQAREREAAGPAQQQRGSGRHQTEVELVATPIRRKALGRVHLLDRGRLGDQHGQRRGANQPARQHQHARSGLGDRGGPRPESRRLDAQLLELRGGLLRRAQLLDAVIQHRRPQHRARPDETRIAPPTCPFRSVRSLNQTHRVPLPSIALSTRFIRPAAPQGAARRFRLGPGAQERMQREG